MKYLCREYSAEALKYLLSLPDDAVITGVTWSPEGRRVNVYCASETAGYELGETSIIIPRRPDGHLGTIFRWDVEPYIESEQEAPRAK